MSDALAITDQEIALRLGLAFVFGMVLGLERELSGKPAGLKTHMLITLGAAATTLACLALYVSIHATISDTRADPLRAIQGVIGAIGFIGAGTIIRRSGQDVQYLTTAADIWLAGAIGLTCGAGLFRIAAYTFGFTLLILTAVRVAEHLLARKRERR